MRAAHLSAYTWPFRSAMHRVLDGFTTRLNFKLSDRVPADKIALAEVGTVLFESRSVDTVRGTTEWKLWRGKFITITLKLNLPHLGKKVSI